MASDRTGSGYRDREAVRWSKPAAGQTIGVREHDVELVDRCGDGRAAFRVWPARLDDREDRSEDQGPDAAEGDPDPHARLAGVRGGRQVPDEHHLERGDLVQRQVVGAAQGAPYTSTNAMPSPPAAS